MEAWDCILTSRTASLGTFAPTRACGTDVAASLDGDWIASGGYDRNLRVWDATLGAVRHVLRGHKKTIAAVRALPDGRLLTGSEDGTVRVLRRCT